MPPRKRAAPPPAPFAALIARIDRAGDGVADDLVVSGFRSIDRSLGGGPRQQDLLVLAGDVGAGKSALALAMALRSARAGQPTLFLTGEMSPERARERALALEGKASIDDLRSGRLAEAARAAVAVAALQLREAPLHVASFDGSSFDALDAECARVPRPRLVVVDSLQLVPPPRHTSRLDDRLALAVAALKALAIRRDAAVMVTAHLPRFRRDRADRRPVLDDLGGHGAVKQQADVVLGLYREEMYAPDIAVAGATELLVLKNRNGATGFVDLYFHQRWLRFEDMLD